MAFLRRICVETILLAVAAAGLSSGVQGQSQTTSAIRGSVVREDDTGVADATVTIRHTLNGTERSVLTDAEGHFTLLLLQPGGPYVVTASRLGFSEAMEEGIQLQVGETHTVRLVLEEQPLELEGVTVSVERSEIFDREQVGPAMLLNERAVQSIPVPSRNVMDLSVLSPLVHTTETGGFSIGGQNDRYNSILVDGLLNNDAFGLTAGGIPGGQAGAKLLPLDAVAQYEVLVAPYDASLSGFAGGVLNAVTRSGTNEWQMDAFAIGRDDALMGDLTLPSGPAKAAGIQRTLLGISAGGPLVRDRGHIFTSGEFERRSQPPSGYNLGRDPAELVGIVPGAMEAFQAYFDNAWGVETGKAGAYSLDQTLGNVFTRADWSFDNGNRLTVRNVFAYAANHDSPNRAPFEPYELSSNAVMRRSTSNTASAQFFLDMGNRGGNEISLTVQRITDDADPTVPWPQVEAVLSSPDLSFTATRPVRVGSQFFAQENHLAQNRIQLANTLTLAGGRNTWTLGVLGTWYDIHHRYLPGATGDWYFPSWVDVLNNAPQRFQQAVLLDGQAPSVVFHVAEAGAFLQDQIEVGKGLTLRAGLRLDLPFVLDHPAANTRVLAFFGRSTAEIPSGMVLLSPRLGFNWQAGGRLRTQIRGGAGLFTGQLPHVWLSNAFENTGLRFVTRLCTGRWTDDPLTGNTSPPFDPNVPPESCLFGIPTEVRVVTIFEKGFHYPRTRPCCPWWGTEVPPGPTSESRPRTAFTPSASFLVTTRSSWP